MRAKPQRQRTLDMRRGRNASQRPNTRMAAARRYQLKFAPLRPRLTSHAMALRRVPAIVRAFCESDLPAVARRTAPPTKPKVAGSGAAGIGLTEPNARFGEAQKHCCAAKERAESEKSRHNVSLELLCCSPRVSLNVGKITRFSALFSTMRHLPLFACVQLPSSGAPAFPVLP